MSTSCDLHEVISCNKDLTVIEMFVGPIISEGVDTYLFEQILDPLLPGTGLPIPVPVRIGLYAIELQYEAGLTIAAGEVAGKSQYTGQAKAEENAARLGFNLIYQPGGMKI